MRERDQTSLRRFERILAGPGQDALRVLCGFLLVPILSTWPQPEPTFFELLWLFLGCLLSIRVAALGLRRLPLFSPALRAKWSRPRALAKRYDSFQWAKLLWIGVGMAVYVFYAGSIRTPQSALAVLSVGGGGLGAFFWRRCRLRASIA